MAQPAVAPKASSLDPAILMDLKRDGLIQEGHYAYRSGRHSALLIDRDRLLANPAAASRMGYALAKKFFIVKVDTVAAPSIWGAGLAQWVAYFLDPKASIVYATPKDGRLTISDRLTSLLQDQRVLLIDNLVISGETLTRFDAMMVEMGAEILGLGTLWNASDPTVADHEVFGLLNDVYPAWPQSDCPLCAAGQSEAESVPY